ncbi:MAG: histidine phosphotransferase family protein [Pararhodobacter sp.]
MTDDPDRDLAALIGSRICHDLVNPLGAIGNGVELLELIHPPSPELALLAQSVMLAQAKLRLFRLAFGMVQSDQQIAGQEIVSLLGDLSQNSPLRFDCDLPASLSRADGRLIALMLLCCQSAMPWGGQIGLGQLAPGQTGSADWRITTQAPRMKWDAPLWQALCHDPPAALPPTMPAQVHFALVPQALMASGRRLRLSKTDTALTVSF